MLAQTCQNGQTGVGKAHAFEFAKRTGCCGQAERTDFIFCFDDFLQLLKEPGIDPATGMHLFNRKTQTQGLGDLQQAVGCGCAQRRLDRIAIIVLSQAVDFDFIKACEAGFERAQGLLQGFLKSPADGHGFAHGFHGGGQGFFRAGEFFKGKTRDLGHHIINGRLKGGGGCAACDVIVDFIQRIANGQFGCDLGNRKSSGLGGQSRGARHPRIHLNHDHAAVFRIDGKLHIRSAGFHADFAQHRQRGIAHDLVFFVGQGQSRRDSDRVTRMHAHGVDVFNRANDDAIIRFVADHFHFIFFPTQHAFFDQHFAGWGGVDPAFHNIDEFGLVIGNAPAGPAHGEGGADNGGKANIFQSLKSRSECFDMVGARCFQTDLGHGVAEQFAIFRLVDGFRGGADHFHIVFFQNAHFFERQGAVERGLSAHGGQ